MSNTSTPLPGGLSRAFVADRLKAITIELIAAHRQGRQVVLDQYALKAGLWSGPPAARPPRVFMKLIQIFHPDRLESLLERVAALQSAGDTAALELLLSRLSPLARTGTSAEFVAEAYAWETAPGDFGFGESAWKDHDDGARLRRERLARKQATINIVEAMRREHFGNLDLDLTRHDLEEMEGELELVDLAIESLSGVQLCRHLTGLNLAANRIHDLQPLRKLRRLKWLDLSGNDIEDADPLDDLVHLEELDLSDNDIDDIGFLENLGHLHLVNLSGNPIRDPTGLLERLTARGVVVIR